MNDEHEAILRTLENLKNSDPDSGKVERLRACALIVRMILKASHLKDSGIELPEEAKTDPMTFYSKGIRVVCQKLLSDILRIDPEIEYTELVADMTTKVKVLLDAYNATDPEAVVHLVGGLDVTDDLIGGVEWTPGL